MFKLFKKKYKLKICHFDSCHGEVTRIVTYDSLEKLKKSAEYISKYPNTICEVL